MADNSQAPIIKKIKKVSGHGHHGGAWKVAYADFVTAMMAFFLLMWLLNATSEEQRKGLSQFFGPPGNLAGAGGAGGVLGGQTVATEGSYEAATNSGDGTNEAKSSDKDAAEGEDTNAYIAKIQKVPNQKAPDKIKPEEQLTDRSEQVMKAIVARGDQLDKDNFQEIKESLKQAVMEMPELKELAKNLIIDETPEGLRIQIVDQQKYSMFSVGEAKPYPHTVKLLELVAKIIQKVPNKISVTGHTDASQYRRNDYTNWELSADRANAARRVLSDKGVEDPRIVYVSGKADKEPLKAQDPSSEQNRRISIVLHRMKPIPGNTKAADSAGQKAPPSQDGPAVPTPGNPAIPLPKQGTSDTPSPSAPTPSSPTQPEAPPPGPSTTGVSTAQPPSPATPVSPS